MSDIDLKLPVTVEMGCPKCGDVTLTTWVNGRVIKCAACSHEICRLGERVITPLPCEPKREEYPLEVKDLIGGKLIPTGERAKPVN